MAGMRPMAFFPFSASSQDSFCHLEMPLESGVSSDVHSSADNGVAPLHDMVLASSPTDPGSSSPNLPLGSTSSNLSLPEFVPPGSSVAAPPTSFPPPGSVMGSPPAEVVVVLARHLPPLPPGPPRLRV